MKINQNGYSSIEQAAAAYLSGTKETTLTVEIPENGRSFAEILSEKSGKAKEVPGVNFTKHAAQRLNDRNIELSEAQLTRLFNGTQEAGNKGINSSLVMVDDLAFIVNTKSNTVVTAMDPASNDKNVFTNIDGAVIA
ncbi:MAG: flagellar protein [Lachnospiraceae bacterium]|nr:flagellar protein [Lachnospiraceae bacterium]